MKALSFLLTKGLILKHIALEVFERLTFNYAASGRQQNREGEIRQMRNVLTSKLNKSSTLTYR